MWVGVTRITGPEELRRSYDESGERLMHVQAAVEDYDVFTRCLSIGPQTVVMRYDVTQEHHYRYVPGRDFLDADVERELVTISRLVNAFFRWELNSCETIAKDGVCHPIDYANASPDLALTSLNYHFPWSIEALVAWCVFCTVTGRAMRLNQATRDYFAIGDSDELEYSEKLERYRNLSDAYLQAEAFEEFRAEALPNLDELTVEYVESSEFDALRLEIIKTEERPEMQEPLIARSRELIGAWAAEQRRAPAPR